MRALHQLRRHLGDLLGSVAVLLAFLHTDLEGSSAVRPGRRRPMPNA